MRITKDNAIFSQNKFNFYIGNIDTTETILIDSAFIIIGDIKTSKNILAEHDLIVMGDIEAKSIYICKDLLCTGKINTEISEVEGKFKVLEKNILEKTMKLEILQTKKYNICEDKKSKLNKDDDINLLEKNENNENNIKYKRITREKDLNEEDLVIHNSLGEGKFISMSKDKIKIDFKTKGVREISKNVTFKLGLLKKKIQNEVYYTKRDNLSKEEYIKKIDDLINSSNKSKGILKNNNENILINKNINVQYKNKLDIITNKIYKLLQQYNYDLDDINIKNIEVNNNGKYLVDLEIKYMKSVSSTVSLIEYLSCKISELTKEDVKLNLSEFDKGKFISEIMEVSLNSLKKDIHNNKYYIIIDIDDFDIKNTLLEENKDYIKSLTGYSIELTFDDKNHRKINICTNKNTSKKISTTEQIKSDRLYSKTTTKILKYNKDLEQIGKDDISKLLLTQNVAFKNEDIYEFECGKIKKSYSGYTFDYVKYNGKIYIRSGQISNILNLDINRLYPYLEESIKIHYVNSCVSNAKFSSSKSILKAINKVQQMYPHEKLSENRVELITKCIDYILKSSKNLNNNTPYWRLVLEHMMFDLNISSEELKLKWGISSYDIELMALGFSPSRAKSRTLIKDKIKI